MIPLLNGKDLMSCDENDLLLLIENEDFRENEYIDYKRTFSFLELEKGVKRDEKKREFKNDICSFANTDGGYILYGISEKKGYASSINGIDIPNYDTDRFELDRRNDLNGIQPKIPQVTFHFIKLKTGKYVVILYINKDSFTPYVHIEDEKNYKIYKRSGNEKKLMSYMELRQMFNYSLSLEKLIADYIKERVKYYKSLGESFGNRFVHICFIPETFSDRNYNKNVYVLEKAKNIKFSKLFSSIGCDTLSIPCVEGLRYIPHKNYFRKAECYIKNNGVVEVCLSLEENLHNNSKYPEGFLACGWLWEIIENICSQYIQIFKSINNSERIFVCLSIIGCKDVVTEYNFEADYIGRIDRNEVFCEPIELFDLRDTENTNLVMKKLYISSLLSIGIKYDNDLKNLINQVYRLD